MDWITVLGNLGTFAIASGVLAWLIKTLFEIYISKDLETFKMHLQTTHDREIERLRTDLQRTAFEHETRFAKLHETRAEVIAELYRRLVAADRAMIALLSPMQYASGPSEKEREAEAAKCCNDFNRFFFENQIYFSGDLCNKLDDFSKKLWAAWIDYQTYSSDEPGVARERRQTRFQAWKTVSEQAVPIKREIEKDFRTLLGHSESSGK